MRTLRTILAVAFLIGTVALAVLTWATFTNQSKSALLIVGSTEITHWMLMATLMVISLVLAVTAFPGRSKRPMPAERPGAAKTRAKAAAGPRPQAKPAARPQPQAAPAAASAGSSDQAAIPAAADSAPAADDEDSGGGVAEEEQLSAVEEEDEEGMSLEIKERMKKLVNLEQKTITNDVARELVIEYYPELAELIYRIDDPKSLETFTRHIISIARVRLKLSDKHLADDQFSIFQRRLFDIENEEILMMYAPANPAKMNEVQKPFYGKAVDQRHWEKLQRALRAEGDDWSGLSVKNAKSLISATGKGR